MSAPPLGGALSPATRVGQAVGLARTTYLELTRQPVYGVVLAAALVLVATSPLWAVFSIGRAQALVLDLGASTLLFACVFLAATALAAGVAEQVQDGTAALLLTHPVGPSTWCLGALGGALLALAQATLVLGLVLLWAVENGPDRLHLGVTGAGGLGLIAALGWGLRASLAGRSFQAAALAAATVLFPAAHLLGRFVAADGALRGAPADLAPPVALAAAALAFLAGAPFAALGIALATRLSGGATAAITLGVFVLSSVARPAADALGAWGFLVAALPDLQLYWVADAAYGRVDVPPGYVAEVALYSGLYAVGALAAGAALLEGRELGR